MKVRSIIVLIVIMFFTTNCGDNKAASNETQQVTNPSASNPSAQGDDIIGEWELVGSILDANDNLQIDEDERKKLESPGSKDYMTLNRDGSGLFTVAKMDGRYEITDQENNGKKNLTWYDKANGRHRVGTIIKVTRDELHIKEPGGHGLFVWKRL